MTDYAALGQKIGELVQSKNAAYGDSFSNSGKILAILYPNGVKPEQYTDMLTVVRILDKLARVATRKDAFGESPFKDIAGYGILGYAKDGELGGDGARDLKHTMPDDPICLECGVGVIPANRTMYCSDACFLKVYPNEFAHAERWTKGEGRHSNK